MTTETPPTSELFYELVQFALSRGVEKINELPGCWEHEEGDLFVAMNGHGEPKQPERGPELPPFNAYVEVNGWPAAMLSPFEGIVTCGTEDELIAHIQAATNAGARP